MGNKGEIAMYFLRYFNWLYGGKTWDHKPSLNRQSTFFFIFFKEVIT